jgi:hypothetical protein
MLVVTDIIVTQERYNLKKGPFYYAQGRQRGCATWATAQGPQFFGPTNHNAQGCHRILLAVQPNASVSIQIAG